MISPASHVSIPEREEKHERRPAHQRHRFRDLRPQFELRLVFENRHGKPVANATWALHLDGETRHVHYSCPL